MFCARYFAGRMFAPRYFPKIGATATFFAWWAQGNNTYVGPKA